MSEWQRVPWWHVSVQAFPRDLSINIGRWELRFFRSLYHNRLFIHLSHFTERYLMKKHPSHSRRYWMVRCDRVWSYPKVAL